MKLSIAVFTRNHAGWLARILPQFQRVADELVVVVNSSTVDNSEEIAREYTSNVSLVPHELIPENQSARIVACCSGDWILGMLDDETLSAHWEDRNFVSQLLGDKPATHYWIPRRWLVPPGERFISNSRWYPDQQMRLFRNIPSLIEYPGKLHSSLKVAGEPRFLATAWIYHWDLIWRDRSAREAKIAEYRLAAADPLAEYYLYEDQRFDTLPVSSDLIAAADKEPTKMASQSCPDAFRVQVLPLDLPHSMTAGEQYSVTVKIVNHSNRLLKPSSYRIAEENIKLSYHWHTPDDVNDPRAAGWENPRIELPSRIEPGGATYLIFSLTAPQQPDTYFLLLDIVEEGVAWFSQFCPSEPSEIIVTSSHERAGT